ncbi:uncharacterized protein LOC133360772 [Lethenteron reissneri]|uniref:uncharacterized protein LOC133360772 n=1 Tax=Lethenteron reissneri TaxID=7753 RepID=UPI002AB78F73|nr:uncharacterized protein LOC133360772 [Lethenteron reissneri]
MAKKEFCSRLEEPARNSKNDAGAAVQDSARQWPRLIHVVSGEDSCDFAPKPFNAVAAHCDWHLAKELSKPCTTSAVRRRQKISNTRAAVCVVTAAALFMTVAPTSAAATPDDDARTFVAGPNVTVSFLFDHVNNAIEVRLLRNGSLLAICETTGQLDCGKSRDPDLRVDHWSPTHGTVFFPEAVVGTYVLRCCDANGDCSEFNFSVEAIPATTPATSRPPATRPSDRLPATSTPPWLIAVAVAVVGIVFVAGLVCAVYRFKFSGHRALPVKEPADEISLSTRPHLTSPPPSPSPLDPLSIESHTGKDEEMEHSLATTLLQSTSCVPGEVVNTP